MAHTQDLAGTLKTLRLEFLGRVPAKVPERPAVFSWCSWQNCISDHWRLKLEADPLLPHGMLSLFDLQHAPAAQIALSAVIRPLHHFLRFDTKS